MRLNIQHKTVYRYEDAPIFSAQVFRLTPRTNISQHVLRWRIDTVGSLSAWTDAFGNACHTLVIDDPPDLLEITARGEVVTSDVNGVLPRESGELPLEVFLRQTDQTEPDEAIVDFAEDHRAPLEANRLDGLHALMGAIGDRVEYETGKTDVTSTAVEAFAAGHGVCQDQAHIFMSIARELGVPTRYVSGYLYDGEQAAPHVAGHAWAESWVDGLGWVSFDVSNCKSATDRYVGLAVGLDYDTACPIRGVRTGGAEDEALEVFIQIGANQQ